MAGYNVEGSLGREEDARPFMVTCKRITTESCDKEYNNMHDFAHKAITDI